MDSDIKIHEFELDKHFDNFILLLVFDPAQYIIDIIGSKGSGRIVSTGGRHLQAVGCGDPGPKQNLMDDGRFPTFASKIFF